MTRIISVLLFVAMAAGAQNFQPPTWTQPPQRQQSAPHVDAQSGPVLARPVSGVETRRTTQTLSDGTVVDRGADISHFYRDSNGRTREESPDRVEIFDPVSHTEYDLNPAEKTYGRFPFSGNFSVAVFAGTSVTNTWSNTGGGHLSSPTEKSGVNEDFGQQIVNGVLCKGSRVTETIPVGAVGNNREIKITNERWYSDVLQILVKSINNDPRFGVNEYELTNISQAPPDPSLFVPPSDYVLTRRRYR